MQPLDNSSTSKSDPYSLLILLICMFGAVVMGAFGVVNYIKNPHDSVPYTQDFHDRVRNGELSAPMVRLAYDEVKRLTNTPSSQQLYWQPSANEANDGLTISGTVRVPNGSLKEFFVKFNDREKRIVSSKIEK